MARDLWFFIAGLLFDPDNAAGFVGILTAANLGILTFILRLLYAVKEDLALDAIVL